jgi:hypothetical protein
MNVSYGSLTQAGHQLVADKNVRTNLMEWGSHAIVLSIIHYGPR